MQVRWFVGYFHFVGWWAWSLGFHIDWSCPNVEIHVPFGFFRLGWCKFSYLVTNKDAKILGYSGYENKNIQEALKTEREEILSKWNIALVKDNE